MGNYSQIYITQQGINLYAKVQAGATLTFTKMQYGNGQLSVGQDPSTFTTLISSLANLPINSVNANTGTAYVRGVADNSAITQATYVCEIGVFAQDPDIGEILYGYANAGTEGDTIPPISNGPFSRQYQFNITVGNAINVTATIPANTYVPVTDMGVAYGVATLDSTGNVPSNQLNNVIKVSGHTANDTPLTVEQTDLIGMVNELFTNANNGKNSVASAIGSPSTATETFAQLASDINAQKSNLATNLTNKNVTALASETLASLVSKVANIPLAQGTATASQVLYGVPFTNSSGVLQTGTMPENGTLNATLTNQNQSYTIPSGHTSGGTVTTNITGLTASVILSGNTVGGIAGTAIDGSVSIAGDILFFSNDTPQNSNGTLNTWLLLKETKVNNSGTIRVKYDYSTSQSGFSGNQIELRRNGATITGTNYTFTSSSTDQNPSFVTETFDISVSSGDLIQVYIYTQSLTIFIQNFRFYIGVAYSTPIADK